MKKTERMGHEHYLRAGSEHIAETFVILVEKQAKEVLENLLPSSLADIMNDANLTTNVLDTVFTDDRGKLEMLIDIYESLDLEFPWEEGYTCDDFFINFTDLGFVDIGENIAECLNAEGKVVDGEKDEYYSRIVHRKYQPVRYRVFEVDKVMIQFIGLYRRWQITHCSKNKIVPTNPY